MFERSIGKWCSAIRACTAKEFIKHRQRRTSSILSDINKFCSSPCALLKKRTSFSWIISYVEVHAERVKWGKSRIRAGVRPQDWPKRTRKRIPRMVVDLPQHLIPLWAHFEFPIDSKRERIGNRHGIFCMVGLQKSVKCKKGWPFWWASTKEAKLMGLPSAWVLL